MRPASRPDGGAGRARRLAPSPAAAPFWRDERVLNLLMQIIFVAVVGLALWLLYANMQRGLRQLGLTLSFGFLRQEAGFAIAEGIAYSPSDSYIRALAVGLVNSLRICALGVVLTTVVGLVMGVSRLSANWLVRAVATVYVEAVRNTPLLLQLLFWYGAVVLSLPSVRQAYALFGSVFVSQRGVYLPRPVVSEGYGFWAGAVLIGAAVGALVYAWRARRLARLDRPGFPALWAFSAWAVIGMAGWMLAPGPPIGWEVPKLQGFNFRGGASLSPEFTALLLGLVCYTGAFIAEVVRGGIQSVARGQREAARALGLTPFHEMCLVILPQALRVAIPPVTSQYLNLIKNSSLGVAIGFPELFGVGTTILNQTGQAIPVFTLVMAVYLGISLLTSLSMNWYNRRARLGDR